MTAQHKAEKAERLAAYAAKLASWQALDARSDMGTALKIATHHYTTKTVTAVETKS